MRTTVLHQLHLLKAKGTTVIWTNNGATIHTVTSDDGTSFDSGTIASGGTYSHTFNTAGSFAYLCQDSFRHGRNHYSITITVTWHTLPHFLGNRQNKYQHKPSKRQLLSELSVLLDNAILVMLLDVCNPQLTSGSLIFLS